MGGQLSGGRPARGACTKVCHSAPAATLRQPSLRLSLLSIAPPKSPFPLKAPTAAGSPAQDSLHRSYDEAPGSGELPPSAGGFHVVTTAGVLCALWLGRWAAVTCGRRRGIGRAQGQSVWACVACRPAARRRVPAALPAAFASAAASLTRHLPYSTPPLALPCRRAPAGGVEQCTLVSLQTHQQAGACWRHRRRGGGGGGGSRTACCVTPRVCHLACPPAWEASSTCTSIHQLQVPQIMYTKHIHRLYTTHRSLQPAGVCRTPLLFLVLQGGRCGVQPRRQARPLHLRVR